MNTVIVGLGGALRTPSTSLRALELALDSAAAAGAQIRLIDINKLELPLFRPDRETPPDAMKLAAQMRAADGVIWSSPLYHGSISGAFKNAVDWLQLLSGDEEAYLTDKPIGMIATAGGVRSIDAINTMTSIAHALRGWPVPFSVPINQAGTVFAADGSIRDPQMADKIEMLGYTIVMAAHRFADAQGQTSLN